MVKFGLIIKEKIVKIVMENVTLYTAFIAGILSFLSPCVLPLLPGYISFISGESIETLTAEGSGGVRLKAFLGAIFFGLGFTLIFVMLGAGATQVGQILKEYKLIIGQVAGVVLIIFGLHMAGILRINKLLIQKKWSYQKKGKAPFFIEAFILGVAFVFGWTPCIGPVLAGIIAMASQEASVSKGIMLLFTFGLGLWIPFLLSALMIGLVISFIRKAGKIVMWVEKISGVLLVTIGILMLFNKLQHISAWLIMTFPALGNINY